MLLVLNLLIYFILSLNAQNAIAEQCYLNSLETLNGSSRADFFKTVEEEIQKLNLEIKTLGSVQFLNQYSNYGYESSDYEHSRLVYFLKFKVSINLFSYNLNPVEIEKTCGAQKKCINQKCSYGIITDKS